jgi:O-antigen ligase
MGKQEILLLGTTAVVWLAVMWGRPFVGLMYFYLYTGLYYTNIFGQFRWLRIPFVTSVLVLISMLVTRKERFPLVPQTWLMVVFFAVMCMSRLANGLGVFDHEYMDFFWKAIFLQILIVGLIDSRLKLRSFAWIFVITSACLVYVSRYYDATVPYGWMNQNDFAGVLVAAVPFASFLGFASTTKLSRVEGLGYFAVLLFGIAATNSRGGYLALAVVLGLTAMANFKPRTLLVSAMVVVGVMARVSDVHWERLKSVRFDMEQGGTGGQRLAAWGAGANMLASNLVLGVGVGEFPNNFAKYATPKQKRRAGGDWFNQRINAHNTIVQLGAETGLLGLAVWFVMMGVSFRDIFRALRLCRGDPELDELRYLVLAVGIGFTGYLVAGLFGNYGYYYELYTFVGLAAVARRLAEQEHTAVKEEVGAPSSFGEYPQFLYTAVRTLLFVVCIYIGLRL